MNISGLRIVKLPDEKICLEIEETTYGGSETSVLYSYFYQGNMLNINNYPKNYYFRILNVIELKEYDNFIRREIYKISEKI